ncbi:hypothetical protein [Rhodococcus sp. 11-3]|uniref:hypothetical protein n=1 Tax=Rhodococcus sp. 11-3 TaxID=2854796 RepID=UPI0020417039|nr:hypothetical protein [Rhodococcus sp. 11-3]USC16987.1 hypothetical protein KZJ41_09030 [Rhodococcus sp. 11-3]
MTLSVIEKIHELADLATTIQFLHRNATYWTGEQFVVLFVQSLDGYVPKSPTEVLGVEDPADIRVIDAQVVMSRYIYVHELLYQELEGLEVFERQSQLMWEVNLFFHVFGAYTDTVRHQVDQIPREI